jgi:hypothetical protein
MTTERLIEMLDAKPFHPFEIRLAGGRAIRVEHPEFVARSPSGRTAVVFQPDDSMTVLDVFLAASLDRAATRKGESRRRR